MKNDRKILLVIFVLALVLRYVYLFETASSPYFAWPVLDEMSLDNQGLAIASGGPSGAGCFRAPLYPLLLGAVYSMDPGIQRFFDIKILQHTLGALVCVLVFIITREAFSRRAGIIAGLIAACYGPLIFHEGEILIESFFVFLVALALCLLILGSRRSNTWLLAGGGFVLGAAAITRPNILPFVPVVFAWAMFVPGRGGIAGRFGRACAAVLPVAAIVGTVTLGNWLAAGDFVVISAEGGSNFYLGNNPTADGMPPRTRMTYGATSEYADGVEVESTELVRQLGREHTAPSEDPGSLEPLKPSAVSDFWYSQAFRYIRGNPAAWLKLMAKKTVLFWNDFEIRNVKDFYFCKRYSRLLRVMPLTFGIVAAFGLLGLVVNLARRPSRESALLALYVLVFSGTLVAFFVCGRLRLPVVVGLIPFAGAGVSCLADPAVRKGRTLVFRVILLAALAALVFTDWYHVRSYNFGQDFWCVGKRQYDLRQYDAALESFARSSGHEPGFAGSFLYAGHCWWQKGDYGNARQAYETVLKMEPRNAHALNALGVYEEKQGDPKKAEEFYRRSIEAAPDYAKSRTNLGLLLLGSGRLDEGRALLDAALRLYEGDPETWLGLAIHSRLIGDAPEAEKYIAGAVTRGDAGYRRLLEERVGKIQAGKRTNPASL